MPQPSVPRLSAHYRKRLVGEDRARKRREVAETYVAGASIRAIAGSADMSYGTVRLLLLEADVKLRKRGGAMTGARRAQAGGK